MKERPIPMNVAMVRATLDGSKRQTRRICKPAEEAGLSRVIPAYNSDDGEQRPPYITPGWFGDEEGDVLFSCPHGHPGDRLWVREAWRAPTIFNNVPPRELNPIVELLYEADGYVSTGKEQFLTMGKYRPPMFMPRWASRILLEITGVRAGRLQDISDADAISEGVKVHPDHHSKSKESIYSPVSAYRDLWESINGAGSWDANPWVWVIEFKMVKP